VFDTEPSWRPTAHSDFSTLESTCAKKEKAYSISLELPGIEAKDIDVSVSDDTLVLKGEKRQAKGEKDKNYYFSDRSYGLPQRAFQLPSSVDCNQVSDGFSNGVLTITLPKTAQAQQPAKKTEVKSSSHPEAPVISLRHNRAVIPAETDRLL
jgi:HSP20 family protein